MCESDLLDESKASLGDKMDDNLDDKNREQSDNDNDNDNDNDTVILNDKTLTVIYCKYSNRWAGGEKQICCST